MFIALAAMFEVPTHLPQLHLCACYLFDMLKKYSILLFVPGVLGRYDAFPCFNICGGWFHPPLLFRFTLVL